ncbi:MAG: hypothetical protein AAGA55_08610 [Planctomycetota bacterium]
MNSLGIILLFANLLFAPMLVMLIKGVRGIVLAFAIPWLVLSPRAGVNLPGLPMFTKDQAVSLGVLFGVLLFRGDIVRRIRLKPVDVFVLAWLCSASISSLTNGLGPWDAMSEFYGRAVIWGVPYFIGRAMIRTLEDVRQCAIGVIIAGLIAAPLCLIEIRLSPQLHKWVYGIHAAPFHMSLRLGAYRPTLMFRHGIEVGSWMACASIVALWFAVIAGRQRFLSAPAMLHAALVLGVTVLCRSLGSLVLLFGSSCVALFTRATRLRIALVLLVLATPCYIGVRITGMWSPDLIADTVERYVDADRAASMRARTYQEEELGAKAARRRAFGWGGHNRFRVFDDQGDATTAVDALWLIAYGKNGVFGLIGLYGMVCFPALMILRRTPARLLIHQRMAGVVGLLLAVMIATGDSLQNAFFSPLMTLSAGVLATTAVSLGTWLPRRSAAPAAAPRPDATNNPELSHAVDAGQRPPGIFLPDHQSHRQPPETAPRSTP